MTMKKETEIKSAIVKKLVRKKLIRAGRLRFRPGILDDGSDLPVGEENSRLAHPPPRLVLPR